MYREILADIKYLNVEQASLIGFPAFPTQLGKTENEIQVLSDNFFTKLSKVEKPYSANFTYVSKSNQLMESRNPDAYFLLKDAFPSIYNVKVLSSCFFFINHSKHMLQII